MWETQDHVISSDNETSVPLSSIKSDHGMYSMCAQQKYLAAFAIALARKKCGFVVLSLLTFVFCTFSALRLFQNVGNLNVSPAEEIASNARTVRPEKHSGKKTPSADDCGCFPYGTNTSAIGESCVCLEGWNGDTCSVPKVVWLDPSFRRWHAQGQIKRRRRPRTIISSFMMNHEIDLLDIRIHVLGDAVDYYLVVESNYTHFGSSKPLFLKSNLSAGVLSDHRHKIVLLESGTNYRVDGDGWAPETNLRRLLWKEGRHRFNNLRDDDLYMLSDVDEIPSRELMLFLKYHDGFGEPILLGLRWFLYGFFWENDRPVVVGGICTIAYLREVYGDDSNLVRRSERKASTLTAKTYTGTEWTPWTLKGTAPEYAGWHCSWCFSIVGIEVKLASSKLDDGTRWGDFPEKHDHEYIKSLRKEGRFFDESAPLKSADGYRAAPAYLLQDVRRWRYLLAV